MKEHYSIPQSIKALSSLSLIVPEYVNGNENLVAEQWNNRLSTLQKFLFELQSNLDWQSFVSSFLSNKDVMCDGVFSPEDPRSEVYILICAYLSHPQIRTSILAEIDEVSKLERDSILNRARDNNNYIDDVDILLIGGSGLHGTISAVEIQANNPGLKILSIDGANLRGGVFRSYSDTVHDEVGLFDINSRHNQPAKFNKNDTQPNAAAHLVAITAETYPSQNLLGATIAVNGFLTVPSLLDSFATNVVELDNDCVETTFNHNREAFKVKSKKIIISTGVPKTYIPNQNSVAEKNIIEDLDRETSNVLDNESENIPTFMRGEDFLKIVSRKRGKLFSSLSQKRVVVIGQGDTAQGILKLLSGYGRKEVYEGYVSQFGRPQIEWIVSNRDSITLRPQHEVLRKEILDDSGLIKTVEGRASSLEKSADNKGIVKFSHESTVNSIVADFFIYCTGPQSYTPEFPWIEGNSLNYVSDHESNELLGRGNNNVFIVGPAANIPLTSEEIIENPEFSKMRTPPIAMRRLGYRTRKLARAITLQLK